MACAFATLDATGVVGGCVGRVAGCVGMTGDVSSQHLQQASRSSREVINARTRILITCDMNPTYNRVYLQCKRIIIKKL